MASSPTPPPWSHKVTWERADIFQPLTWAPLLKGADYVVHSMGILLEADYKGAVSGRESPLAALSRAFASAPKHSINPLARGGADIRPPETDRQMTYEAMNRDTAVLLAKEASRADAAAFAYISAAGGAPVLPQRYIRTKREAEDTIASEFPRMRGVFVRAPFMYDSSRPVTVPLAAVTGAGALFNGATGGIFNGLMGAAGVKPLRVETVAEAVIEALSDEKVRGPVEVPELEELATKGWRRGML